jgi:hypothetical protein
MRCVGSDLWCGVVVCVMWIRYDGTLDAFSKILKNEGVAGFWKGVGPNIVRNSIM